MPTATALPPIADFTGASVTEGQFKTALTLMHDFVSELQKMAGDVASASTTNIGAADGNYVRITGTTTITAFDTPTAAPNVARICLFAGALTLTHNASRLILPGGANITTTSGDVAVFVHEGGGNWRCIAYHCAGGFMPVRGSGVSVDTAGNVGMGGTTPATWYEPHNVVQLSPTASVFGTPASTQTGQNGYTDAAGTVRYLTTGAASLTVLSGNTFTIYTAPSGTAGNVLTWTQPLTLDNQNLLLGYTSSNGSYKLQVNSQIFATSATVATSDARYKTVRGPITDGLAMVMAMNPVEFDWNEHPVHNFDRTASVPGFLAQEMRQALEGKPYLNSVVKSNRCKLPDGTEEEFLGIAEGNIIAILTAAIKELKGEKDALAERVAALESRP